jgi:small-conductance mechanosensitive channel
MALSPELPSTTGVAPSRIFGWTRLLLLFILLALFLICLIFAWTTRGAMANLPFLQAQAKGLAPVGDQKALVDLRPWQTAQALAPLAVTAEEAEYAREAIRLADHEVEQAFDSALRKANVDAQHRVLTGDALALSQKVDSLEQVVAQDQSAVSSLMSKSQPIAHGTKSGSPSVGAGDDLEVAKAQLDLDSDDLADAQRDLNRVSGDDRAQIQSELAAHKAAMTKYESQSSGSSQVAVVSARQRGTLASRIKAWFDQNDRAQLIQQALQQAQADNAALTVEHNKLEAAPNSVSATAANAGGLLAGINERREQRQLLSIFDDRIQTEQQLATVYGKWSAQVNLQHRIVLHLMMQSLALIALILICMILSDALVQHLLAHPSLDWKRMQTLRTVLEFGVQALGVLLILFVLFGPPRQLTTVLGLATAGLTIALQDFILAFLGWFVLMGKNGIRIGDWVEINGVGGEVTEIGLIYTTLLETGNLEDKGHPTGRRISFINGYAIRGPYFNFSTSGQWMWDEITVPVPASANMQTVVDEIQKAVEQETAENTRIAEQEWKRGIRGDGLSRFSAAPVVNLRPSGSAIDVEVRYVTRASDRFELRNRLYQQFVGLIHAPAAPQAGPPPAIEKA